MHWILVYNALFFFDFLFNRIVPNLYISNAGLGTEAEKVEKLSPLFFYVPRNSLVCRFYQLFIELLSSSYKCCIFSISSASYLILYHK